MPPKSLGDIRKSVQHASSANDPDNDNDSHTTCPNCGAALCLSVDTDSGAGADGGGPLATGSPDLANGGDEGTGGGL